MNNSPAYILLSSFEDAISSARVKRAATVCGLPYKLSEADKIATIETHNKMRRIEGATGMLEMVSRVPILLLYLKPRRAHTHTRTHVYRHTHTHACRHTRKYKHTPAHARARACERAPTPARAPARSHALRSIYLSSFRFAYGHSRGTVDAVNNITLILENISNKFKACTWSFIRGMSCFLHHLKDQYAIHNYIAGGRLHVSILLLL